VSPLRRRLADFFLDPRVAFSAPLLLAVISAAQQLLLTAYRPPPNGYTHYNNFIIFQRAFFHLLENRNLYGSFPAEHFDNFLYTPTFAALMAPFAPLPVGIGLVAWDLLNAVVLVLGVRAIPGLDARSRALSVWFILPEFLGSSQHSQTNPAIVGLLLLSFWAAEREKDWLAPLFLALAAFVKIFPIVAGLAFLLYPRRFRLILWTGVWVALLAIVPLAFVAPSHLAWQYGNWLQLHTTHPTHVGGIGITTEGILRKWLGLEPRRGLVVAVGALVASLPLLRFRDYSRLEFRSAFVGLMLMWMIAFNHLSESPTFVIAMAGIALWYFSQRATRLHRALLWMAFLLVSVSYSDLVPSGFRARWIEAYALKGVPVLAIWMVGVAELVLGWGPGPRERST
jgi:hypothetical protein